MIPLRIAVYALIALHFLRMVERKLLHPTQKLVMPPAAPGESRQGVTLAALVRTQDEWEAFMVSGAATATISDSQLSWLHHAMYRASDGFLQELSGTDCEVRLCPWSPERKKPHIAAPGVARILGLAGSRAARFADRFDSLVHRFNEAVSR
jgi:hypothetical protein